VVADVFVMVELPASRKESLQTVTAAIPPSAAGDRVGGAALALAVGLGGILLLLLALTEPQLGPVFGPAALASGILAVAGAVLIDRRRLQSEIARLALANRHLGEHHEVMADAEWQLRDSEQHFRGLAEGRTVVEQALVEARQKAEAASEAKSRFLAAVSHEFRTPLNGILGLNGLLLESDLSPDQATYARGVHSSGEALLALVDDMLDFSKIESGRLDLHPEPTDIAALAQEIVELLAGRAHGKAIDLAADVAPDLPAVAVDATRLRQVLINLVGNGVKFTDRGGVTLRVDRAGETQDGMTSLTFAVIDSGPGVAAADSERVFGEFEQGDSAIARRHGGAGLGLAISRRIVRRMNGDIVYRPRPEGGSIFAFTLTLPVAGTGAPQPDAGLSGRRIVIVAPAGAEPPVLAAALAHAGASVRLADGMVAGAALAGAAVAAGLGYDAAFIDARISSDLAAALAELRSAAGTRMPAVVMIEPGDRGRIEALRQAGFDAYLVRPVRRASLLKIAGDVLSAEAHGGFTVDPGDMRQRRPSPRRALYSRDILLAEDNEINALLARAVLEGLGHRVTEVRDGAAAVAAARDGAGRFAAILMDLHMPGLDGIAAARAIRRAEAESGAEPAAILALTADVLPETRAAAALAGIDDVLEKPVTPDALRRAILAATRG
jgi:signal transduction histidine kinase/DNA-binding response OmpR family regulator